MLREIRILLTGLLLGYLFMPALLWFLNFKHGIHLAVFTSPSIDSFYREFYTGFDNPLVWSLLLAPYLLHSLIRLLFHSSAPRAPATEPLEQATLKGQAETTKGLIAQGKDINARNIRGQTPLHLATTKGNSDVVQLLLESGAEVDAVATNSGCTSLHYAASLGHVELCELLVRYGADP
ncbi:MAG: ankyrin repeat domain-containing protein, partial [Gammaproteobacteria bacterium]